MEVLELLTEIQRRMRLGLFPYFLFLGEIEPYRVETFIYDFRDFSLRLSPMLLLNVELNLKVVFCQLDFFCLFLVHNISGHSLILDALNKFVHIFLDLLEVGVITDVHFGNFFFLSLNPQFIYLLLRGLLLGFVIVIVHFIFIVQVLLDTRDGRVGVSLCEHAIRHAASETRQRPLHNDRRRLLQIPKKLTALIPILSAVVSDTTPCHAELVMRQVLPLLLIVQVGGTR